MNSFRILLGESGGDGGMSLRLRLSSCVSFLVSLCLERFVPTHNPLLTRKGFQNLVRCFVL